MTYIAMDENGHVNWPEPDYPISPSLSPSSYVESWLPEIGLIPPPSNSLTSLAQQKIPAEDHFHPQHSVPTARKRRRALEDEPETSTRQRKVHVTEQLRTHSSGGQYIAVPVQTPARTVIRSTFARLGWLCRRRRDVSCRLYRGLVNVCVKLVGESRVQREISRDMAVKRRREGNHARIAVDKPAEGSGEGRQRRRSTVNSPTMVQPTNNSGSRNWHQPSVVDDPEPTPTQVHLPTTSLLEDVHQHAQAAVSESTPVQPTGVSMPGDSQQPSPAVAPQLTRARSSSSSILEDVQQRIQGVVSRLTKPRLFGSLTLENMQPHAQALISESTNFSTPDYSQQQTEVVPIRPMDIQPNSSPVPGDYPPMSGGEEAVKTRSVENDENGCDWLAEDHVYPDQPNVESYWELWPGDGNYGVFGCGHCSQMFETARSSRLHFVEEHLVMTGGAGPAGTYENGFL
jgi:hypothetical protein